MCFGSYTVCLPPVLYTLFTLYTRTGYGSPCFNPFCCLLIIMTLYTAVIAQPCETSPYETWRPQHRLAYATQIFNYGNTNCRKNMPKHVVLIITHAQEVNRNIHVLSKKINQPDSKECSPPGCIRRSRRTRLIFPTFHT